MADLDAPAATAISQVNAPSRRQIETVPRPLSPIPSPPQPSASAHRHGEPPSKRRRVKSRQPSSLSPAQSLARPPRSSTYLSHGAALENIRRVKKMAEARAGLQAGPLSIPTALARAADSEDDRRHSLLPTDRSMSPSLSASSSTPAMPIMPGMTPTRSLARRPSRASEPRESSLAATHEKRPLGFSSPSPLPLYSTMYMRLAHARHFPGVRRDNAAPPPPPRTPSCSMTHSLQGRSTSGSAVTDVIHRLHVEAQQNLQADRDRNQLAVGAAFGVPGMTQAVDEAKDMASDDSIKVEAHDSVKVEAHDSEAHDSVKVEVHDSAKVEAHDSVKVEADSDNSDKVEAHDSAKVEAHDSVKVEADSDNSVKVEVHDWVTVEAHDSAKVEAHDSVKVEAHDSVKVEADSDNSVKVEAHDSVKVEVYDSAKVEAHHSVKVEADSDNSVKVEVEVECGGAVKAEVDDLDLDEDASLGYPESNDGSFEV